MYEFTNDATEDKESLYIESRGGIAKVENCKERNTILFIKIVKNKKILIKLNIFISSI